MFEEHRYFVTRDGRLARVYAKDGCGNFPLHGAILNPIGWEQITWKLDGSFNNMEKSDADLIREVSKDEIAKALKSHEENDSYSLIPEILGDEDGK